MIGPIVLAIVRVFTYLDDREIVLDKVDPVDLSPSGPCGGSQGCRGRGSGRSENEATAIHLAGKRLEDGEPGHFALQSGRPNCFAARLAGDRTPPFH